MPSYEGIIDLQSKHDAVLIMRAFIEKVKPIPQEDKSPLLPISEIQDSKHA
jgi:hypothetical protein